MATTDIKEMVSKAAKKIMSDKTLQKQFQTDPVKALEKVLGVDLPDEILNPIIEGVKAQMTAEKIGDAADFIKKLF